MGASYVEARICEFIGLTHGDRSVVEYEVEFFRLSSARDLIKIYYDKIIRFEEGLRYSIKVLVASQRERVFETLMKAKITEEIKRVV